MCEKSLCAWMAYFPSQSILHVKMKTLWLEEEQIRQKKYDSWKPTTRRISRFRRPITWAVCAVALTCLWLYAAPSYVSLDSVSESSSALDPRSHRHSVVGSPEQGPSGWMAISEGAGRLSGEDPLLAKEESNDAKRFPAPRDREGTHGVQPEHPQHVEHQHNEDEMMAGHENYEQDQHTSPHKALSENDAAFEDKHAEKGNDRAVEEEHNPDHNSNFQIQEALHEAKANTPNRELESGKEGVIASADTEPKPNLKPVEKEPEDHLSLEEKGETLPEILHIPFEDVVANMKLAGWEDEWIAHASFDVRKFGALEEPKIDFIYLWVNGSEEAFRDTKRPYEENSILNDVEGIWLKSHGKSYHSFYMTCVNVSFP